MPMLRALRALNAIEAGTTTGAQLETLLADAGRLGELNALLQLRGQARRMAASSTAMTAVAASARAMTAVISSQAALDAVFSNPTAKALFKASTALTAASIPTMTSNVLPSGEASASSFSTPNAPFNAFDKKSWTRWVSGFANAKNQWLQYAFPAAVFVQTLTIDNTQQAMGTSARDCRLECSGDGVAWETALALTLGDNAASTSYEIVKAGKYRYWRLFLLNNYGNPDSISLTEMSLAGTN